MISHQLGASYIYIYTQTHTDTRIHTYIYIHTHFVLILIAPTHDDTSSHTLSFLPMLIGLAIVPLSHPPPTVTHYNHLLSLVVTELLLIRLAILTLSHPPYLSFITELLGVKHATISLRSDMTDVVAAIKTDKQLFLPYYFGTE